jgi:hypothetical protein
MILVTGITRSSLKNCFPAMALSNRQPASMVPGPGRPKTSAAFQAMNNSWKLLTIPKILNVPKPSSGVVDISIQSGSI